MTRKHMNYVIAENTYRICKEYDYINEVKIDEEFIYSQQPEVYGKAYFDGWLLSRAVISDSMRDKIAAAGGMHKYYKLPDHVFTIADCGAFTWIDEPEPQIGIEELLEDYVKMGFTHGMTLDHVIRDFSFQEVSPTDDQLYRQQISIKNALDMKKIVERDNLPVKLIGACQGWSPQSFVESLEIMGKAGFDYCAVGGLMNSSQMDIYRTLKAMKPVCEKYGIMLHVLGVSGLPLIRKFNNLGIIRSFDSTSPFKTAIFNMKGGYLTKNDSQKGVHGLPLIYIPKMYRKTEDSVNPVVKKIKDNLKGMTEEQKDEEIKNIDKLGYKLVDVLTDYDNGIATIKEAMDVFKEYNQKFLFFQDKSTYNRYINKVQQMLLDKPWVTCGCAVCKKIGINVAIYRTAQRHMNRGFHNMKLFYEEVDKIRSGKRKLKINKFIKK